MKIKGGKQGIAGAAMAVVPSSNWEINEWEFQSPDRARGLCTSQSTTGAVTMTPILIPNEGDFPLWERSCCAFVMFLWQVIFIHRLQEPDVGPRGCTSFLLSCKERLHLPCRERDPAWRARKQPGQLSQGRARGKTCPLPGPAQGVELPPAGAAQGTEEQSSSWIFGG